MHIKCPHHFTQKPSKSRIQKLNKSRVHIRVATYGVFWKSKLIRPPIAHRRIAKIGIWHRACTQLGLKINIIAKILNKSTELDFASSHKGRCECACKCKCVCVCVCVYICVCARVHVWTCVCVCAYVCVGICVHVGAWAYQASSVPHSRHRPCS